MLALTEEDVRLHYLAIRAILHASILDFPSALERTRWISELSCAVVLSDAKGVRRLIEQNDSARRARRKEVGAGSVESQATA